MCANADAFFTLLTELIQSRSLIIAYPKGPAVVKILRSSNPKYFATAVVFYYLYRFLPFFLLKEAFLSTLGSVLRPP